MANAEIRCLEETESLFIVEDSWGSTDPMSHLRTIKFLRNMGLPFSEAKEVVEAAKRERGKKITFDVQDRARAYAEAVNAIQKGLGESHPPMRKSFRYMVAGYRYGGPPIVINTKYENSQLAYEAGEDFFRGHPQIRGIIVITVAHHEGYTFDFGHQPL